MVTKRVAFGELIFNRGTIEPVQLAFDAAGESLRRFGVSCTVFGWTRGDGSACLSHQKEDRWCRAKHSLLAFRLTESPKLSRSLAVPSELVNSHVVHGSRPYKRAFVLPPH